MTMDLSVLADIRSRKPKQKDEWQPLDLATLYPGTYLAADQSLTAFGVVLFEVFGEGLDPAVHFAQKITVPETNFGGWEDILQRSASLCARLTVLVEHWVWSADWGLVHAVHEAPPIGGGKFVNPEVSLITAREFRAATMGIKQLPMIQRQTHARLLCGNGNAKKPVYHAALKELYPHIRGSELITNEAHRDALCVALAAAKRGF